MHEKTFAAINKLKDIELELHRLKNALEMANKALDAQRPWVRLTEEDLKPICDEWRIVYGAWMIDFARDIEIKIKEKNT